MKFALRRGVLAFHVAVATVVGAATDSRSQLAAQEPCPRASGADADAGWVAYGAGDMVGARTRFEAALARCADDRYAQTGLGYVLLRANDVAGAVALWNAVVAAEPDNVDALTGLGIAAWRSGDPRDVRARFTRVLELVPDHATAREYLDRLEGRPPARPRDPADEAWMRGDAVTAERLYQERLARDPNDDVAAIRVGLVYAWRGEYREALVRLGDLVARQPSNRDARLARARVRAWSGDVSTARREVLGILELHPDNREALEALALFHAWEGDLEAAVAMYDDLIAISPQAGELRRRRAQVLAWAAQFEASRAAYDALLSENPDDVEARLGLAQALAYAQDFDASVAEYDRVLVARPGEARALLGKARVLGWAGRLVEGERVALEALAADSASAAAWSALGEHFRWQGRPADALEALQAAARLAPTDAAVLDQLRAVELALAPAARPVVIHERDSDDNRMTTTMLAASWHVVPRLDLRAVGFYKDLRQGVLRRSASGLSVSGTYELRPGWRFSAGIGGSQSDGAGQPAFIEGQASLRTPERYPYGVTLAVSSAGVHETAALAHRGVRSTDLAVTGRWHPSRVWQLDGSVGVGRWSGTEKNGRRSASLAASTALGGSLTVGVGARAISFEKDLDDGYFDPDFYGVAEITGRWQQRRGPWTLLFELAPGLEQVGSEGRVGSSLRASGRVAYGLGPGREVWLASGYSSAGLTSFATGAPDYRYTAFMLGSSWTF
jgi:tetratricopeptide (TPR) repeat protein